MFRLKIGYLLSGIATGLVLLFSFILTIPDGKLHLVFCDVGQGDAIYVRFPDGRDMLIDGGPNNKVLGCLGRNMPFWDRKINLVVLTHPQRDHLQGLIEVVNRFAVDHLVKSDVGNATEGYTKLIDAIARKRIPVRLLTQGQTITIGLTKLTVLWPSPEQITRMQLTKSDLAMPGQTFIEGGRVLGASATNVNDASIVFWLRYGSFDAILPGDADSRVEVGYRGMPLALRQSSPQKNSGQAWQADEGVEVLKVPHHGSKSGMTEAFLDWLFPASTQGVTPGVERVAVISVGRNNSYGHPAPEILKRLKDKEIKILRTDEVGDIEVVSDGRGWETRTTAAFPNFP